MDNLHALQKRIQALTLSRAAPIPTRHILLSRPLSQPWDKDRPGEWTNDPARTAAAAWVVVDWIMAQPVIPPGMAGALERCVETLETIIWTVEGRWR